MNTNIKRSIEYIPKCDDNKKSDNPCVITIRNLTMSEARKALIIHAVEKDKKGEIIKDKILEYDLDFMFNVMITNITNNTVTDEKGEIEEIKTGQDILDSPGLDKLYLELVPVLIKMEARVNAKN